MPEEMQIPTLLDKFDFSNKNDQAELIDAITYDLDPRGRDIMTQRLGLKEGTYQLTLNEVAKIFRTDNDEIMAIESRLVASLTRRGIPLKA